MKDEDLYRVLKHQADETREILKEVDALTENDTDEVIDPAIQALLDAEAAVDQHLNASYEVDSPLPTSAELLQAIKRDFGIGVEVAVDIDQIVAKARATRPGKVTLDDLLTAEENRAALEALESIRQKYQTKHLDTLLESAKDSVIQSVVGPFGIGHLIAKGDKDGGNVLTEYNARKVYEAGRKNTIHTQGSAKYDRNSYVGNGSGYDRVAKNYKNKKTIQSTESVGAPVVKDEYSGDRILRDFADVDHVIPIERFHYLNGGFMISKDERQKFATDEDNFALTHRSINRSKGSKSNQEADHQKMDGRRTRPRDRRAEKTAERHAPTTRDKIIYYGREGASAAAGSGAKMGIQQATGILLQELTEGLFEEAKDIFHNGLREDSGGIGVALARRAKTVLARIKEKWRDVLEAFGDGAISGFLSEIVTIVVNKFATTAKRMVRIIREGFFALMRAIKLLVFPPNDMTKREAADAALKLIATALTTAGGVLAEEAVETALAALVGPLAPYVAPVVMGILAGLASALTVYTLDKLDLVGAQKARRDDGVVGELNRQIEDVLLIAAAT